MLYIASVPATEEITGDEGGVIQLRCPGVPENLASLVWGKVDENDQSLIVNKAKWLMGNTVSLDDRLSMDSNYTLTITNLKTSDEGTYSCHLTAGEIFRQIYTKLYVTGKSYSGI